MDIACKHCGEPFDTDEFHENGGTTETWKQWMDCFKQYGCRAVDAFFEGESVDDVTEKCKAPSIYNDTTMDGLEAIQDLLGDDIDGICSMQDDFINGYLM